MPREVTKTEAKYKDAYSRLSSLKQTIEASMKAKLNGISIHFSITEGLHSGFPAASAKDGVEMTFLIRNDNNPTPRLVLRQSSMVERDKDMSHAATELCNRVVSDIICAGIVKMGSDNKTIVLEEEEGIPTYSL